MTLRSNRARQLQDFVLELNYGLHSRPSEADTKLLARLVDEATAGPGLTLLELKRHLHAALNRVKAPNEGGARCRICAEHSHRTGCPLRSSGPVDRRRSSQLRPWTTSTSTRSGAARS